MSRKRTDSNCKDNSFEIFYKKDRNYILSLNLFQTSFDIEFKLIK